ncbi:unnamed protein product [Boreogadus saida]
MPAAILTDVLCKTSGSGAGGCRKLSSRGRRSPSFIARMRKPGVESDVLKVHSAAAMLGIGFDRKFDRGGSIRCESQTRADKNKANMCMHRIQELTGTHRNSQELALLALAATATSVSGKHSGEKGKMKEAAQRYQYALRKFPRECFGDDLKAFKELRVSLYLNLSRCRRKTNDFGMAEEFASKALELKPKSYEAYYARARAKRSSRQFTAAMADLHEAAKLCPNNREIRRLLARVDEECKQMQRATQVKPSSSQPGGAAAAAAGTSQGGASGGGHDSDMEPEEGQAEGRSLEGQRNILEEEDEEEDEDEDEESLQAEGHWPQNAYSLGRVPPPAETLSTGHQNHGARPGSPPPPGPGRLAPHRYPREHREALAQQGLVLQSTKQAQIVKTNQHMSSMGGGGGGAMGGRPAGSKSQYGPSSPLPSRHMSGALKAGPGIDISPLPTPPADEPVYGERFSLATVAAMVHHGDGDGDGPHLSQTSSSYCSSSGSSKGPGQEPVSSHSAGSSLDGLACSGPLLLEPGKEAAGCSGSQAGCSGSIRVSSSTSSLASSSGQSESGKLGPDVRSKTSDKAKHSQPAGGGGGGGASGDWKRRPFMGVMDKTARFQQQLQLQQQQQLQMQQMQLSHQGPLCGGRTWQNHSMDVPTGHSAGRGLGMQSMSCDLPFGKMLSTYQEQQPPPPPPPPHKPAPPHAALPMGSLQNGVHGNDFTDKFCQAAAFYKQSKPALAMKHPFMGAAPVPPGLTRDNPARDNPALHVSAIKPKRSFIESNV